MLFYKKKINLSQVCKCVLFDTKSEKRIKRKKKIDNKGCLAKKQHACEKR